MPTHNQTIEDIMVLRYRSGIIPGFFIRSPIVVNHSLCHRYWKTW